MPGEVARGPSTRHREIKGRECDNINTRISPVQVKDGAEQSSQGADRTRAGHKDRKRAAVCKTDQGPKWYGGARFEINVAEVSE